MEQSEMIGSKIGRLEILAFSKYIKYSGKNRAFYICKCDCGTVKDIAGQSLVSGRVNSCGCIHDERTRQMGRNNCIGYGESSLNTLYLNYKYQAIKRHKSFNLSREEFRKLTKQNCYYCGAEPNNVKKPTIRGKGEYIYNGVDRVDNTKGYSIENCVACCTTCNRAKQTMREEEFLNWIRKVYEHRCSP